MVQAMQKHLKINISTNNLIRNLEKIKNENMQIQNYVNVLGLSACKVYYEDLVSQRDIELSKILEFLNVDNTVKLKPRSVKITSDDLTQVIQNYQQYLLTE